MSRSSKRHSRRLSGTPKEEADDVMYPANPHIDANHSYVALPFLCVEALRLIQDDERAESASLDGGVKATKSYFAPGMILTAAMRGVILNAIGQSSLQYQRVNGSVPSMLLRAKLSRAQKGLETSSGREDVGCMNECPVCGQWFSHKGYMEHTKYNTPIQPTEGSRLRNSEMSNSLVEWEPGYPGYPGLPKHAFLRINAGSCRQLRSTPPCQARSMLRQHGFWFNSQIFRGRLGPLLDLARHREALLEKENVNMYQYDYYADGLTRASDVIDADGVDYREYFNTLREHVSFLVGEIFPELSVTYQEGHDKVRFFNGSYHTPLHADHTLQHRLVGYDTTNCTLLTVWVALSRTKKARDALCFYLPGGDSTCLQEGTVACMVDVEPGACAMFLETTPHFCPKEQCWRKYPKGFRASVDMRFVISPADRPKHLGSELKEELASDSPAIRAPEAMHPVQPQARLG
ncbi:hypothetical protein FOZ62_003548 [Perkinsus olseni]|uniref:Uncharacterized protein n=1 Tax=Perkinsus olseni TaxID=32597 RepID=A0A7J6S848_PEROL|nr:hypothetical protein FOZ62_003548 [Perkinsus olseni]